MPAPIPEPGAGEEQPPGGAPGPGGEQESAPWWGGAGWAWVDGSADTGPLPGCERPGPQPGSRDADGLDYAALLDALAAAGALGGDDQDAEFAEWQAAEAEGRLQPADPAQLAAQAVEHMPPGPAQAGWLEVAAAGMGRLDEYGLVGVTLAAGAQEARAAATKLSAIARLCAATAAADPKIGLRHDGRPARVSRDALGQIENALLLTHYQAEDLADLAIMLAWRLPATGQALAAGSIDLDRAKLIAQATSVLDEELARAVEAKILPGAGGLARTELRDWLARAVICADPEGADRRREQAERHADVRLHPDDDQTATITGSKLPQIHAAAAIAKLTALARACKAAGMPGTLGFHRAQAMIALILGTLPPIPPPHDAPPDRPHPITRAAALATRAVAAATAMIPLTGAMTATCRTASWTSAARGMICPRREMRTPRPTTGSTTTRARRMGPGIRPRRTTTSTRPGRCRPGRRWARSRPGWPAAPPGPQTGGRRPGYWTRPCPGPPWPG